MKVSEYGKELYELLKIDEFADDISLNGFQIECDDVDLRKAAFAVDASFETIDRAVKSGADILVVHHGLFWGFPIAVRGIHYRRLKRAFEGNLSLFACHLPLDAHPLYGNNAQMALKLGMKSYDPFGKYHGKSIGYMGRLPSPMSVEEIAGILGFTDETGTVILKFGKEKVETVGIVSGGAGDMVDEAIEKGLDLFITGTCPHEVYNTVKENGVNMLSGGHYGSEVFGVRALQRMTEKKYGIETVFIEAGTGL